MTTKTLDNCFEAMTIAVFRSGLSATVVHAKWDGFGKAFEGFDPRAVAEFGPQDVTRLLSDDSIIRNRRKIEATIHNANRMLDLEEAGGFARWLRTQGNEASTAAAISREFRHMGPVGTKTFLRMVASEDVREVCR
jgi:DNA-3-methyladenine glycosylase I